MTWPPLAARREVYSVGVADVVREEAIVRARLPQAPAGAWWSPTRGSFMGRRVTAYWLIVPAIYDEPGE